MWKNKNLEGKCNNLKYKLNDLEIINKDLNEKNEKNIKIMLDYQDEQIELRKFRDLKKAIDKAEKDKDEYIYWDYIRKLDLSE